MDYLRYYEPTGRDLADLERWYRLQEEDAFEHRFLEWAADHELEVNDRNREVYSDSLIPAGC